MTVNSLEKLCAQKLAPKIIELEKDENFPKVVWENMCEKAYTREEFLALDIKKQIDMLYYLDVYSDGIRWYNISLYRSLSEPFIEKFADKVNWYHISYSKTLSESFIEKWTDKVDWY